MHWKSLYYYLMRTLSFNTNRKTFYDIMLEVEQEERLLRGNNTDIKEILKWIQRTINIYGHVRQYCQEQVGKIYISDVYKLTNFTTHSIELRHEKTHSFHLTSNSNNTIEIELYTIDLRKLTSEILFEENTPMHYVDIILCSAPHKDAIKMKRKREIYKIRKQMYTLEESPETEEFFSTSSVRIGINNKTRADQLRNMFFKTIEHCRGTK